MLLLGLVTITPMLSGAASAHRAHLDASVSCDGTVEWTATSWSQERRRHRTTTCASIAAATVATRRRSATGRSRATTATSSPATSRGPRAPTIWWSSTEPKGEWGNGEHPDDEGHDEVELDKPDCDGDAHVEHELQCEDSAPGYGDGEVTLTLSNPAGPFAHDVEFDVYDPDQDDSHQTYTVPAGGEQQVTYHDLEDGHHHIKVTKDDEDHSRDVEVDCDQ